MVCRIIVLKVVLERVGTRARRETGVRVLLVCACVRVFVPEPNQPLRSWRNRTPIEPSPRVIGLQRGVNRCVLRLAWTEIENVCCSLLTTVVEVERGKRAVR